MRTDVSVLFSVSCTVVEFTTIQTGKIQTGSKKPKTRASLLVVAERQPAAVNGSLANPSDLYAEGCKALSSCEEATRNHDACYLGSTGICSYSAAGHAVCLHRVVQKEERSCL